MLLQKAVERRDTGLEWTALEPLLTNLQHDPRWQPFLHKMGMASVQLAAIEFDVPLPE